MQDLTTRLSALSRPRLLVRAARMGAEHYQRTHSLAKLLPSSERLRPAAIVTQLLDLEHAYNKKRLTNDIGYHFTRHIEILIALQAEARLFHSQRAASHQINRAIKNGPQEEAVDHQSVRFALNSYENASGMDAFFSAT